jgi:hypothetical protein
MHACVISIGMIHVIFDRTMTKSENKLFIYESRTESPTDILNELASYSLLLTYGQIGPAVRLLTCIRCSPFQISPQTPIFLTDIMCENFLSHSKKTVGYIPKMSKIVNHMSSCPYGFFTAPSLSWNILRRVM